jgi:hypothetical protein
MGDWTVRVTSHGRAAFTGVAIQTTHSEVLVEFKLDPNLVFGIGEQVAVEFLESASKSVAPISGRVVYRGEDEANARYRIQISEAHRGDLIRLLNQRGAYRLKNDSSRPVLVRLRIPGTDETLDVELQDLSRTGVSVLVLEARERDFAKSEVVRLSLRLEPGGPWHEVEGLVRYRMLQGSSVRYGIEFHHSGAAAGAAFESALAEHFLERERELLRRRKAARGE